MSAIRPCRACGSIHTGMGQPEHGPVTERDAEPGPRERSVKLDRPSRDANPPCALCGGPHPFDTSLPSPLWNRVIRDGGLPDYLCTTCIVLAFVKAGESFEAELYGEAVDRPDRVPVIRVQIDDRPLDASYGHLQAAVLALREALEDLHGRYYPRAQGYHLPGSSRRTCWSCRALADSAPEAEAIEARIRWDERKAISQMLVKLTRLDTEASDYSWIPLGEALVALDPDKRALVLNEPPLRMHTDAIRQQAVRDFLADPATRQRLAAAIDMMFGGAGVGVAERCRREADWLLAFLPEPKP